MNQKLRLFMMTLLCAVFSVAWGEDPEVTLNFLDGTWGFPTSSKVVTATSYTNSDGYTITVEQGMASASIPTISFLESKVQALLFPPLISMWRKLKLLVLVVVQLMSK